MKIKRLLIGITAAALLFSASPAVFAIGGENAPVPYASLTINGSETAQIYTGSISESSVGNVLIDVETKNVDECSLYRGTTKVSNILNGRLAFTVIYILQGNDTYTLKCTGQYGNIQDTARLERLVTPQVDIPKPGEPIVNITANNQDTLTVVENSEVTINWSSQNADSCTVTRYFYTGLEGEFKINQGFDGLYIVYCYNSVGSSYDFVKVYAVPPKPATLQLNGTSTSEIEYGGGPVVISWDAHESYKCMLDEKPLSALDDSINLHDYYGNNVNGQPLPTSSGHVTVNVDINKSYQLICDSPYSRLMAYGTVTVKPISFGYVISEVDKLSQYIGKNGTALVSVQQALITAEQVNKRGDSRLAVQKLDLAIQQTERLIRTGKVGETSGSKLIGDIETLKATLN